MSKTVDLFIKSYRKGFWLLKIALETIKKNLTGYNNIQLLIPEKDKAEFDTRDLPYRTLIHYVDDNGFGWLRQQVFKLKAHEYCFSDYIVFSDSDAFVDRPTDLSVLINDGKPEILFTDYEKLPDAIIWKKPTSDIIGEEVKWEYMRRLGLCYHRETLVNLNTWQPNLENIVMASGRFSEFNLIGAYSNKFENDKYTWTNTEGWSYTPPIFNQVWSHSNKTKGESEIHHLEYIRLLETVMKCFGVPVPNKNN